MMTAPRKPDISDVISRMDSALEKLTVIQRRMDVHDQLHLQISSDMARFGASLRDLHDTVYGSQNLAGHSQRLALIEQSSSRSSKFLANLAIIAIAPFVAAIVAGIIWSMAQVMQK